MGKQHQQACRPSSTALRMLPPAVDVRSGLALSLSPSPLPGIPVFFPTCLPSFRQISQFLQRLIPLQHRTKRHDGSILHLIRGPAQELPIAIRVMANQENRQARLHDRLRREHGSIAAFLKSPGGRIIKDRLALAE